MDADDFPKYRKGDRIIVTSALPYVNGVKHLGNLVGSLLPADVFHRFLNLLEIQNIYICGTDEHGAATEISAAKEKLSPKDYSEKYHKIQADIYKRWGFDFTCFGRTSSPENHEITIQFFNQLNKNGFISKNELMLPYCTIDKKFLTDRYVEGTCPNCGYKPARGDQCENCAKILDPIELIDPYCVLCGKSKLVFKKEKHLFLDLGKVAPQLEAWINRNKNWPQNTRAIALSWLKEGLKPRCITRNLEWGIRVPLKGYTNLVFYVWFDAPIGYIGITASCMKDWKDWWSKAKVYHFLGKDNIPFHTIFLPGILLAVKSKQLPFNLPHYVAGYEFMTWEGYKFSTSRGVGIFSDEALELFPTDYWRYYLMSILPEKKDSDFSWSDFQSRINNELIANYANVFYRITSFIDKYFGKVPRSSKPGKPEDEFLQAWQKYLDKIEKCVKKVHLKDAMKEIMAFSDSLNRYFQVKEPWFAIQNKLTKKDAATTVYYAVNGLAAVSALLQPIIPSIAEMALTSLSLKPEKIKWKNIKADLKSFNIKPGTKIRPLILVQRIEDDEIEEIKKKISDRVEENTK